jgi:protein-S-isoprenylcysteine O-methyltransferase Ste14
MQKIASGDETIHPWAEARRWLLVVPVALLPFLIALAALIIVKTILSALGVAMFILGYFLAAAASAFLSVTWSVGVAPRRAVELLETLSVTYVVISVAALVLLLVVDQHPPQAVHENEVPELIQMVALAGLGVGAVGGYIWGVVRNLG